MFVARRALVVGVFLALAPLACGQAMMLAHWSFDDPAGTGVLETVQGLTETVVGSDVRVTGPFGTALQCNGLNTYIDTAVNQSTWNYLTSFTVTCWLRPAFGQGTWVPVVDQHSASQAMGVCVGLSTSNGSHIAVGNATTWQPLYGPSLTAGVWTHCAFVFDAAAVNGELACYLNGVLTVTTNIPGGPMLDPRPTIQMRIGARVDNAGFLNAALDDLAIFDGALSATDILDIMANGAQPGFPEYQTNSWQADLDVNSVQGTQQVPATVTVPVGMQATLGLASGNLGMAWDLGSGAAPLIPTSAGALLSSDGQIVNLDVTDPTLSTWFNFLQGPTWGPVTTLSIPFSLPSAISISAQMIVVSPALPSGVALSQPVRLIVQ